jgi:hypothetical protein
MLACYCNTFLPHANKACACEGVHMRCTPASSPPPQPPLTSGGAGHFTGAGLPVMSSSVMEDTAALGSGWKGGRLKKRVWRKRNIWEGGTGTINGSKSKLNNPAGSHSSAPQLLSSCLQGPLQVRARISRHPSAVLPYSPHTHLLVS